MRSLSLRRKKRKGLDVRDKVVKQIITGLAVPKSLGMIELEKNYALLAEMISGMIDRMRRMENEMEHLEAKMGKLLRAKGNR